MRGGVIGADGAFDLAPYPPAPVVWATALLDTVLDPLGLDWRRALLGDGAADGGGSGATGARWLAARVPSLPRSLPALLTFQEFRRQPAPPGAAVPAALPLLNALYRYAFATPSTALGDLTTPEAVLVLLLLVGAVRALKALLLPAFRRVGAAAAHRTHGPDWAGENPVRIAKFGEYVFRLLYHSAISVYGVWSFGGREWWTTTTAATGGAGTRNLFRGFPDHEIEPQMAWYYLIQSAYNLDALVSLLELSFVVVRNDRRNPSTALWRRLLPFTVAWSPDVRGDFNEMFVHHVVTNLLIIGSSFCRLTRIGSMVFLVHDLSDIPVDCSKLANFVKYKKTTIACFVAMVLVWVATRLYLLPFVIFRAALTESHYVLDRGLPPLLYVCYRHFFYGLLAFLVLLHLTWFGMFLRIFHTMLHKNEVHDYSEHKSGERQELGGSRTRPTGHNRADDKKKR